MIMPRVTVYILHGVWCIISPRLILLTKHPAIRLLPLTRIMPPNYTLKHFEIFISFERLTAYVYKIDNIDKSNVLKVLWKTTEPIKTLRVYKKTRKKIFYDSFM